MAGLELIGVRRHFGSTRAVDDVSLAVASGEFIALLGPSGCGKTSLLRLIAGFDAPDGGQIQLDGQLVAGPGCFVPPEHRRLGMVFQSYALWPHLNVAGNVGFALEVQGLSRSDRRTRIAQALEQVGLVGLADRRPADLSGGQRQRVALARCLAMQPRLILLDEPLANLDAHLRERLQREFRRLHRELGTTFLYVTHDQHEAMALADRVAVLDQGRVAQLARPEDLYRQPANAMVARFLGGGLVVPVDVHQGVADLWGLRFTPRGVAADGPAQLCLRPADLWLSDGTGASLAGRVVDCHYRGGVYRLAIRPDAAPDQLVELDNPTAPAIGTAVRVAVRDGWVLPPCA